jgi:hypothetical protein
MNLGLDIAPPRPSRRMMKKIPEFLDFAPKPFPEAE